MRVTAVPAQVTTVEDRIVGSLNVNQLLLLCTPVFGGGLLYIAAPPFLVITFYKVAIMAFLAIICGLLAIRIKGTLVLSWLSILLRYWLRPRYYIFDKRSTHSREQFAEVHEVVEVDAVANEKKVRKQSMLSLDELSKIHEIIENPAAKLAFETRKGDLYVRIRQIKQES
jgi:hypothetical protein